MDYINRLPSPLALTRFGQWEALTDWQVSFDWLLF